MQFRDLIEAKKKLVWKKLGDQYTVSYSDDPKQVLGMFMKEAKGFDDKTPSYEVNDVDGIAFKKFRKIADAKKYVVDFIQSNVNEANEDADVYYKAIAELTGVRKGAIQVFIEDNGLSAYDLMQAIGQKKTSGQDVMTAIVGNTGNKYFKNIVKKFKA